MRLRRPIDVVFALGCLGWPVGVLVFGGFDDETGETVIGVGCLLVLASLALELVLRRRDAR